MRTREEDFVSHLFVASTHAYIMIFSDRGRAYWLKVHEIPDVGPGGKGKAIANLVSMEEGEKIAALLAVREFPDEEGQRVHRHGHPQGRRQEDRPLVVQQPARRRHHRDGHRGRRLGHRRRAVGRHRAGLPRHQRRHGDPVRGERRAPDGPHRLRRPRHHPPRRRRGRGDGGRARRAGRCSRVAQNGYGKRTDLEEYRLQTAAASASSTSRPPIATARSSAWPTSTKTTS